MREALKRNVIERHQLSESEYLSHWDNWIEISAAAIRAAGYEVPWGTARG